MTRAPSRRLIVLDPGHGSTPGTPGFDPGAVSGLRTEAAATLEAALTLKALLIARGWTVRLTHDGTQGAKPDLARRVQAAREWNAAGFISLHYDQVFLPPRHSRGVYHAPGTASLALAQAVQRALGPGAWRRASQASRFGQLYIDAFPDRHPAILVELDSITYAPPADARAARLLLLTPIANAIHTHLTT